MNIFITIDHDNEAIVFWKLALARRVVTVRDLEYIRTGR